jgi:hypothetical protein
MRRRLIFLGLCLLAVGVSFLLVASEIPDDEPEEVRPNPGYSVPGGQPPPPMRDGPHEPIKPSDGIRRFFDPRSSFKGDKDKSSRLLLKPSQCPEERKLIPQDHLHSNSALATHMTKNGRLASRFFM